MKKYAIGIDVGGTTCKMGFFTTEGELLWKGEIPTNTANGGAAILPDLSNKIDEILAEQGVTKEEVNGIGIGIPGPVTSEGVVNRCVNLGWGVVPLEKEMSELTGLPVKAANDANIAALGEAWMGSGKDYSSVVMVTLGTGVGGGIILNDKIIAGFNGAGGEIGHMNMNPEEGESCNCGNHGCLEQYASATGIVRLAKKRLEKDDTPSALRDMEVTAKTVFDCAKEGDALANEVAEETCEVLGRALASISCVVDPEAYVLGGGVSKNGPFLVEKVERNFAKYAFHACKSAKILLASLSNDAGIYGGAKLASDL